MPRRSRIDAAGALHHVMVRGIERGEVFQSDADWNHFLERLGEVLKDTQTLCYAWALIPNHFHLFLRTGPVPISTVMRPWQNTEGVPGMFGENLGAARQAYRAFVEKGIAQGRGVDLTVVLCYGYNRRCVINPHRWGDG